MDETGKPPSSGRSRDRARIGVGLECLNRPDKRRLAVEIRRALCDLTVGKDIIVATPDEIRRRGHLIGSILRSAIAEGKVLYERP